MQQKKDDEYDYFICQVNEENISGNSIPLRLVTLLIHDSSSYEKTEFTTIK